MAACAPSLSAGLPAEFASETSYNLTWQYGYVAVDGQHCAVTNPKVGLHINMVLPDWQQSLAAANGFAPSWQSFITSLVTHENGHVALDKQYAATLLSDVQNQPPMDCSSIVSTVQAIAEHDVTLLNQANHNYDALTVHGATQGALLRYSHFLRWKIQIVTVVKQPSLRRRSRMHTAHFQTAREHSYPIDHRRWLG